MLKSTKPRRGSRGFDFLGRAEPAYLAGNKL